MFAADAAATACHKTPDYACSRHQPELPLTIDTPPVHVTTTPMPRCRLRRHMPLFAFAVHHFHVFTPPVAELQDAAVG